SGDVHGCNSSLQRQMPDQTTQDGTPGHWRAFKGTPRTADRPRDFFLVSLRGPGQALPGSSGAVQRVDRRGRVPAPWAAGLLRTTVDSAGSLRTIPHYPSPPHTTIQPPRVPTTHRPKPTPIVPSILYT